MMRTMLISLVLAASCGGPFDPPPCDAGAADMVQPADLGRFLCGNGNNYCRADQVCLSGDCVPASWDDGSGLGD